MAPTRAALVEKLDRYEQVLRILDNKAADIRLRQPVTSIPCLPAP